MRQFSKPTKVLYIITQGEVGGAQQYLYDLATHLPARFEAVIAMGSERKELGNYLISNMSNVKVVYLKHLVRNIHPIKEILALFEIKKLIETEKPDIVHLNSSKAGVLGSLAGALAGNKNIIFTTHGLAFLEPRAWIVRQIYYWAERLAMPFRAKVITVSENDRQEAIKNKLGRAEQFVTVHNGIEEFETLPREEARRQLLRRSEIGDRRSKLTPNSELLTPVWIGTIAHDYNTKDLPTLRKAFAIVKKDYPNLKLVIIGRGSEIGEVPEARKYLSAFDIYVCSSVKEGFPYSVLEAAAAGLPIVATKVGGVPEIIDQPLSDMPNSTSVTLERSDRVSRDSIGPLGLQNDLESNGILVEPGKPEEMAREIRKLIENRKLREELGEKAREQSKKFTISEMVRKTLQVYNELLSI